MNIMKKVLKFAVMALAAALTLAACEKKGGEEETPKVSVDGKQWCFEWSGMGMPINCVLDLGVNTDKTAYFLMDGAGSQESWIERMAARACLISNSSASTRLWSGLGMNR